MECTFFNCDLKEEFPLINLSGLIRREISQKWNAAEAIKHCRSDDKKCIIMKHKKNE